MVVAPPMKLPAGRQLSGGLRTVALIDVELELREALVEKMILDGDYLPLPALPDTEAAPLKRNQGQRKNPTK